jgi:hypothetical protein
LCAFFHDAKVQPFFQEKPPRLTYFSYKNTTANLIALLSSALHYLIAFPSSPLPSHFLPSVPGFTRLIIHPDKEKWAKKYHRDTTLKGKVKRNEKIS